MLSYSSIFLLHIVTIRGMMGPDIRHNTNAFCTHWHNIVLEKYNVKVYSLIPYKFVLHLNGGSSNQAPGTVQVPMTFRERRSFVQPQGTAFSRPQGSGILLVEGNATLEGEVRWDGMILVTGTLFLNGQGSGIVIRGGIWAGRIDQQTGPFTVQYDSCRLQAALLAVPTRVRTWKEVF